MDKLEQLLITIDIEILLNCAKEIILKKNKKIIALEHLLANQSKMNSKHITGRANDIDPTGVFEPKKGAFIINTAESFHEGTKNKGSSLIAAFDLDWTLIKPKSGNKFPRDYDDWHLMDGVKQKVKQLHNDGYKIVIFTNQGSKDFDTQKFKEKIVRISQLIDVPLLLFGCTESGYCRKPSVGMWWLLTRNNEHIPIDMKKSFYVGDAAGREKDFSDSDLKFALNIGIKFYTNIKMEETSLIPIHPLDIPVPIIDTIVLPKESQEMIILVGPPASGKSFWCKTFKNYVIACQDELGTKPKVISLVKKTLKEGKSVIIDRKNEYIKDRAEFIDIATEFGVPVRIVWFDIPRELSEHLCAYREIMTGKHIPSVVFNKFYSKKEGTGLQIPTKDEAEVIRIGFKVNYSIVKNEQIFRSYLV